MLDCSRAIFVCVLMRNFGVMVCAQLADARTAVTAGSNSGFNQFVFYGGFSVFK
ncbi:MAG TPA: hypothetical protein VFH01_02620 [Pyrinomonadaceae bacterium]|nr:hypothetical protein [Pyrinomonadaceae bacterium]